MIARIHDEDVIVAMIRFPPWNLLMILLFAIYVNHRIIAGRFVAIRSVDELIVSIIYVDDRIVAMI